MKSFSQNIQHKSLHAASQHKMNTHDWRFFCLTNIYLIPTWPDLFGSTKVTKDYYGIYKFYSTCHSVPHLEASSVVYKLRAFIPSWTIISFLAPPFQNSVQYRNLSFNIHCICHFLQLPVHCSCTHWWQECHSVAGGHR